ncbi:MAG TPA: cation:proton antiporter [Firmicutes bacterium]|nr:cation:proton antiporter [Bacillota bacterium]
MTPFYTGAAILLVLLILGCLIRAYLGPTAADRVVAVNVIGTKAVILLCLVSAVFQESFFLDVALVYALISFLATVCLARLVLEKEHAKGEK